MRPAAWVASLALAVVLGYLSALTLGLWRERQRIATETERTAYNVASLLEALIAGAVADVDTALAAAAARLTRDGAAALEAGRAGSGSGQPSIAALAAVDGDGRHLAGDPALAARLAAQMATLGAPEAGLGVGRPERDAAGEWSLVFHRPLLEAGKPAGHVAAAVPTRQFAKVFTLVDLTAYGTIGVNLLDGTLLMRWPHQDEWIGHRFDRSALFAEFLPRAPGGTGTIHFYATDGSHRLVAYQTVRNAPMVVAITRPWNDILGPWHATAIETAAAGTGILLVVVVLAGATWLQIRRHDQAALARGAAEAASQAKDGFLAMVGHELRTPLHAIIGFGQIIERQELGPVGDPAYAGYGRDIREGGEHLLGIINDILDISKIAAGKYTVEPAPVSLPQVARGCQRLLEPRLREAGLALDNRVRALPTLLADERATRQVLINLLSNAIKFTRPGGRITLEAWANAGYAHIRVSDTGVGIPAADLPRLGRPFEQADNQQRDRPAGTGLGLALSRQLVALQGGDLTVESQVGVGTSVTVRLPLAPAAPAATA